MTENPSQENVLRRLLRFVGIDRAIGYTVLARGWASCAGLITVALIARHLTSDEQGYYYTFGSLVAMQLIFELGFSVVILQLATHEVAHLTVTEEGTVEGEARHHERLASVLRKAVKWYALASVLMAVVLVPVGWHFFQQNSHGGDVRWRLPWLFVVLASSVTFQIDPVFSFLEGCGQVSKVARARFLQALVASVLAWSALLFGHGLFAPALFIAGQALAGIGFLFTRRRLILSLLRRPVGEHAIHWGSEVWPFQWRIAVSYASGFFIFQLFNPVLFHYWGPTVAGQMGMSISLSGAIASIGISWINTKAAPFGAMIARQEYDKLDKLFFRSAIQAASICVAGSIAVLLLRQLLDYRHLSFAHRILPVIPLAFLLATMVMNQIVASMALYLRAHKQEKFLLNSVLGGITVALSTWYFGKTYGAIGVVVGHFALTVVIGIGMGVYTFIKYRRLWHAE